MTDAPGPDLPGMPESAGVGHAAEPAGPRFHGADIPEQQFRDDDGSAPAELLAAIAGRDVSGAVAALVGARLLVGLIAQLDSVTSEGTEKDSHMAAAMWQRPDGRTALMAFSSVAALSEWDATARPLPIPAAQVAQAALADGADALLLDRQLALTGPALWAVAEGRQLLRPDADPQVQAIVTDAVRVTLGAAGLPEEFRLVADDSMRLTVLLHPTVASDRTAVTSLANALAANPFVRSRAAGVQIAVTPLNQ